MDRSMFECLLVVKWIERNDGQTFESDKEVETGSLNLDFQSRFQFRFEDSKFVRLILSSASK